MDAAKTSHTAVILDIKEDKIQIRRRRGALGSGQDFDLLLRLKSHTRDASKDANATLQRLEEILLGEKQRQVDCFSKYVFVLGNQADPFLCGKNRIDLALRVIEFLSQQTDAIVHVQTRSPLSILALPLLKRIADRTLVTMGVETLNDTLAQRFTPWLPRPSERITAARAMHSLGIPTLIQAAPLGLEAEAPRYARTLNEIGTWIYPVMLNKLQIPANSSTCSQGDTEKLKKHLPQQKLIDSIPQAWSKLESSGATTSVAA